MGRKPFCASFLQERRNTRNVLNYLPKSSQAKAKQALHESWMAETREKAEEALDAFLETYDDTYTKATNCLSKHREELLVVYDFPKRHCVHLRTTNAIEFTFGTIRQRTARITTSGPPIWVVTGGASPPIVICRFALPHVPHEP